MKDDKCECGHKESEHSQPNDYGFCRNEECNCMSYQKEKKK